MNRHYCSGAAVITAFRSFDDSQRGSKRATPLAVLVGAAIFGVAAVAADSPLLDAPMQPIAKAKQKNGAVQQGLVLLPTGRESSSRNPDERGVERTDLEYRTGSGNGTSGDSSGVGVVSLLDRTLDRTLDLDRVLDLERALDLDRNLDLQRTLDLESVLDLQGTLGDVNEAAANLGVNTQFILRPELRK
ncbi:MAG: hypothetical protein ACT4QA_08720 [Panacagrimonas sp.]